MLSVPVSEDTHMPTPEHPIVSPPKPDQGLPGGRPGSGGERPDQGLPGRPGQRPEVDPQPPTTPPPTPKK